MGGQPLYLAPRLGEELRSLLESPGLLHNLTDALGSPLNVVVPDQLAANVERFRSVFGRHHLSGQVFFAHKANRSSALLRRLAATDAGVDVASLGELQHALGAGLTPDRITATGPKDPEFLWLAARTSVTVVVDGVGELEQLAMNVRKFTLPRVRVLLRLSGFEASGVRVLSRPSRFGTPAGEVEALLEAVERHGDAVDLTGVAYHLDTTSLTEKATALEGCLRVLEECRSRGLRPSAVDIGGGFGVDYLADGEQWERYTTALTDAVLGTGPPLTWGGHGYGLRNEAGTLRGTLGLYPAHRPVAGPRYLDELLAHPATFFGGRPLAALLLEHLYDLHVEPGRALLDQCGLTLAKVMEVRPQKNGGELLVRLAAKADDVALEEHGVLMDPVVVPRHPDRPAAGPVAVHLFGSLCLETDLITRRTVFLPRRPEPGDLLVFANTAGYCMDFHATRAQGQPVARKIAAWQEGGAWRWCLDDQYWPTVSMGGTTVRYDSITEAIGNTPLVRIDPAVHGLAHTDLYAKLELLNPFGSVKDRAAWNMARPLLADAAAHGSQVVELSSGNTAKALAVLAGMHGLTFKSVTNRMRVPEIKDLLLLLGAEIEELPGQSECLDPTATDDPLTLFHRTLSEQDAAYLHTDQYFNPRNTEAHLTGTGPEILKDLDGRAPDWFIACVGTAGSSTGVARALREHDPAVRVLGLVAAKSDFIPGIRTIDEAHEVGLFDPSTYDTIEAVGSDDAIEGMLTLNRRCGILAGPTGGAAYFGAVRQLKAMDGESSQRQTAVFVVCDRVESYLSYVRQRRPDLFGRPRRRNTPADLTDADIQTAPAIGVTDAQAWIATGRPLVVDLRSPFAFAALHIDGSVNIVDELFEELLHGGLPFSHNRPVLLACPVGEKSARYAALLTRMGHPDVRSLAGGIIAWRDAGAPLVRD